ncbi:MAG: DUF4412 domain-containing protein [bacterium]
MHTTRKSTGLVIIAGLLLTTSLSAQGMRKPSLGRNNEQVWLKFEKELGLQTRYAVDMEMQAMGMTMQSKMYRADSKMRSELTMPFMNMKMVALQLPENGKTVSYSLFPDKKKYCVNPEASDGEASAQKPECKLEELGTEVFEGVTCKKRRMTVTLPDGTVSVMTLLFSSAQKDMPVKIDAQTQVVTEPGAEPMRVTSVILFKNYRFGAPEASLFTIPKDYAQAKDMGEIMTGGGAAGGGLTIPQPAAAGQAGAVQEALRRAQQEQADADADAAKKEAANKAAKEAVSEGINEGIGRGLRGLFGK